MGSLILGVLLWAFVHFIPSVGLSLKQSLVERFGEKKYSAVFSVVILLSLVLIVVGWRRADPSFLYMLPEVLKPIALLMIIVAFVLFVAANMTTRIHSFIRHPQLTGLFLWAFAHVSLNGDSRSVVLFGGLGLWALAEIILINRRDGAWEKPPVPSWRAEAKVGVVSLVVIAVIVFIHPYIAGVPIH